MSRFLLVITTCAVLCCAGCKDKAPADKASKTSAAASVSEATSAEVASAKSACKEYIAMLEACRKKQPEAARAQWDKLIKAERDAWKKAGPVARKQREGSCRMGMASAKQQCH